MATRSQHTHDGGVVERRLRPIYDWLDNGNNKKALQEAEKVLKKSPSLQAARALKALALFRLGKSSEAHVVLDALAEEKPSDDATLQAMTISYRESQQLPKVCALYEAATRVEPTNEELHSHLFMSYVRVGDYKSQQRAAMALYKFAPKNPYYFWAVMSIVLQAKSSDDSAKKNILLALAQRMIDNFISENKMEAEQEVRLYIMVLELQEKWADILKFIEGPLYAQLVPGSTAQACIPYLKKLGEWRRLNLICKELLWDNQDRWDYYLPYLDSVFQLMKDSEDVCDNSVDNTAEKCHEFICQIIESLSGGKTLRGPYLARLELWKRLSENGDPTSLLGSSLALCVQYLRVFAHKACVIPDLRPYIMMIPRKEREESCRDFLTCLGFEEDSEPTTNDDIQRHVSCLSAWRMSASPLPADEALAMANTLRAHYVRCLKQGLVTSTITEFCSADGYAILAAHHYYYAAVQQESSAPVLEALCLLELSLHNSPANFHAKLLLVKLYHLLGGALAADSIYQRIEVKHVQLVSLGWVHTARLLPACAAPRALRLLADTRVFHAHHSKDSVEHLTYSYKFGTFEKLSEVYAWSARLEACAWAALAARERALFALLAGAPGPLHQPPRLPHTPTDNRDLNVIVNFEPPELSDPDLKSRTFSQEVAFLRLKDGLVTAIALCIELADNRPTADKVSHYEQLGICVGAFSEAMEKCKELCCASEKTSISAPFPHRIIAFVNSPVPYRELYSWTLRLVGELAMGKGDSVHEACSRAHSAIQGVDSKLRMELTLDGDPHWRMRERLETLSNYLEFIGITTFLLGVCNELLASANTKRSKKKTNQSPDELKTIELLNKLNESVQTLITSLESIIDEWPKYDVQDELEKKFATLNIDEKYQSPVASKLKNGLDEVVTEIRNILKRKSKYLKTLLQ